MYIVIRTSIDKVVRLERAVRVVGGRRRVRRVRRLRRVRVLEVARAQRARHARRRRVRWRLLHKPRSHLSFTILAQVGMTLLANNSSFSSL